LIVSWLKQGAGRQLGGQCAPAAGVTYARKIAGTRQAPLG